MYDMRCPAPRRDSDFVKLAESLKGYPDTKPRLSTFPSRRASKPSIYDVILWDARSAIESVIEAQAEREGSGRTDRSAGEDAGKVDDVEAIVEIANVALEAHGTRFFLIEIEGSGEIDS